MNDGTQVRLDQTEKLLDARSLRGTWPRWAVWLIRLAVEHELDALWARRSPEVVGCSRRAQLLALGVVLDSETQHRVAELWNTLSRAAHHHHYELAPTAAELRGWLDEARLLCAHLANRV
ncbi:hypothetical protein GCM10009609_19240 [Pseudonocardia aurantiaca]|uniref:DUF4145 domain-containing protein n=1 Tax=Pseudonocardia aurantiaca TaxID=75290 RepID=A0ABW4FPN8_9PSEU